MLVKRCARCKKTLQLRFFARNRSTQDGLQYWCKECAIKYFRSRKEKYETRKRCPQCRGLLSETNHIYCKRCSEMRRSRADTQRIERAILKKDLMKILGSKCLRCGHRGVSAAFHFHHLNPWEKDNCKWALSKNLYMLILKGKIMLLCATCHAEIHYGFHNWWRMF